MWKLSSYWYAHTNSLTHRVIPVCPRTQPVCSEVLSHASGICSSLTCEAVTMVRGCRFHMHDDSGLQYLQRNVPTGIYNCLDVVSLVMFTPGSSIVWIIARCACILVDIQRWVIFGDDIPNISIWTDFRMRGRIAFYWFLGTLMPKAFTIRVEILQSDFE